MFSGEHERLEELDVRPLSRPELHDLIGELERLRSHVDERLMAAKAAMDSLGDSGADSATVSRNLGRRSQRQAKRDAVTAAGLAAMPVVARSLAAGSINVEHAAIVADAAEQTSAEQAVELLATAEAMPADMFAKKARQWVSRRLDPAEVEGRHARQRQKREAWDHSDGDGMVHVHAVFDHVTGQSVLTAWRRKVDELWHADGGRDGTPDEVRTHAQRRADALAELVAEPSGGGTAGSGGGGGGGVHPKHVVHLVHRLDEGSTEFLDGEPVPDSVLSSLGPSADVVGHVFSAAGQPLWVGRRRRLATPAQWLSLIAAQRGCNRCGAGVDRCQAHHAEEWLYGGTTDIDNLELLCHTCHGREHRGSRTTTPSRGDPPDPVLAQLELRS